MPGRGRRGHRRSRAPPHGCNRSARAPSHPEDRWKSRSSALALPTRRPFDTTDQLDERMRRADAAFAMAYELGTKLVLVRAGVVPPQEDEARLEVFTNTLRELGRRAEHHGVKLALETGADPGEKLKAFLDALASPGLAASIDPSSILQAGIDPIKTVRELASWVVHAYANDATGSPRRSGVRTRAASAFRPVLSIGKSTWARSKRSAITAF